MEASCRYLARVYPQARNLYPSDDAVACAEVDTTNDFINFSISGPFFYCFVFGAYFPKAFGLRTESESLVYSQASVFLIKESLMRLMAGAKRAPFLLGPEPLLPDFNLFHVLELGRTFAKVFDMPLRDVLLRLQDAGLDTIPVPPWPTHQKKPPSWGSDPMTMAPSTGSPNSETTVP